MKFEENKKYKTKSGETVEVIKIFTDQEDTDNVVGILWDEDGDWDVKTWFADGSYYLNKESYLDLVPAKTPKEKYIEAQNALGIKPGDTVQIVKIPDTHELDGWLFQDKEDEFLTKCLQQNLGRKFTVESIDDEYGFHVCGIVFYIPYQCLIKVKESNETVKEMTIAEISKALGYEVKIVG